MLSKIWKKVCILILIVACLFNIVLKLVNRISFNKEALTSAQYMLKQYEYEKEKENVIIKTNAYIEKLMGEERLSGIVLNNGKKINLDGIFLAIGMMPDTKILKDTGTLDKNGYVIAGEDCITSADGLFVAGDARTKKLRQIVTAVADGAAAVSSVLEYIR